MKIIVAGSRSITDYGLVARVINDTLRERFIEITELVSGGAKGVDKLGEMWAESHAIPIRRFPAEWNNLTAKGAILRKTKYGNTYNVKAGFDRNERMAQYADILILIWDGESHGSLDMYNRAIQHGLKIYVYNTSKGR